jgi:hypothetical protein
MKDALGKDLVIGQTYGYSRSDNGITTVKIGELVKINEKMVSLEIQESKRAVYTEDLTDRGYTNKIISVKANGLFPVDEYRLGDKVTTEYYNHGEIFTVVGIREKELELRGDWSGGTNNVDQISWYQKDKCKKKI